MKFINSSIKNPFGLNKVSEQLLGIKICKQQQNSNFSQRPLRLE